MAVIAEQFGVIESETLMMGVTMHTSNGTLLYMQAFNRPGYR